MAEALCVQRPLLVLLFRLMAQRSTVYAATLTLTTDPNPDPNPDPDPNPHPNPHPNVLQAELEARGAATAMVARGSVAAATAIAATGWAVAVTAVPARGSACKSRRSARKYR